WMIGMLPDRNLRQPDQLDGDHEFRQLGKNVPTHEHHSSKREQPVFSRRAPSSEAHSVPSLKRHGMQSAATRLVVHRLFPCSGMDYQSCRNATEFSSPWD